MFIVIKDKIININEIILAEKGSESISFYLKGIDHYEYISFKKTEKELLNQEYDRLIKVCLEYNNIKREVH